MTINAAPTAIQQGAEIYNGAITTSYRNNDADNAYMYVNKGGNGNRKTFTLSWWMKTGNLFTGTIYTSGYSGAGASATSGHIRSSTQKLTIDNQVNNSNTWSITSTRVFRDVSSWYNCVVAIDTTQGTASNRVKLYINGVQETVTGTYPDEDDDVLMNNQYEKIGTWDDNGSAYFEYDGYLADFNLIDGTQLNASSFGGFRNGIWIPIDTSSLTRGTKGWRLQFKQTGVGTGSSSTVGADTGGNDFHFTSSNIAASDCAMLDNPENNFCTMNPLINGYSTNITHTKGNLGVAGSSDYRNTIGTLAVGSGKWYWECHSANFNDYTMIGIQRARNKQTQDQAYGQTGAVTYASQGAYYNEGTSQTGSDDSITDFNDDEVLGFALDLDSSTKTIKFYNNNTLVQTVNLSSNFDNEDIVPLYVSNNGQLAIFNFGADSSFAGLKTAQNFRDTSGRGKFFYQPPAGYKALALQNLEDTPISPIFGIKPEDHFDIVTYTSDNIGAGGSQSVTGVNFLADLVWIKNRSSSSTSHTLYDSNRGTGRHLSSDTNGAEVGLNSQYGYLSAFASSGFTLTGGSTNANYINQSTDNYVAWCWKANGGTTSSNTDGTTTSTVQANTAAGFSIVTYAGNSASKTVGHGLDSAPEWVIVKSRTDAERWAVFHTSISNQYIYLNENFAGETSNADERFGDSSSVIVPNSTVVTLGANNSDVNENGDNYIMYCFHSVEGYSRFGQYEGNASDDGTYVYLGFRPRWVMLKNADATESGGASWIIYDTTRSTTNVMDDRLFAEANAAEAANANYNIDFLSNGFKIRDGSANYGFNNANTYIYMAFAETSVKNSNAR
jgi:hypothetical protein|tara:strand:+ start:1096 stop:3606 length:2511 start_codon:yes stop_codon:yes gene_type:complete